jgi:hypothetical protein
MENTFIKTIQGHQLEFSMQLPGNYNISPKNVDFKGVLSLQKDEKGMWNVDSTKPLPAWFNEISMHVHFAIEENEAKENNESILLKYANPF